jgi:hypothetical protein
MGDYVHIITVSIVTNALEELLALNHRCAKRYAMKIMDLFGFDDRIIDNILDQPDRQLFYLLEAKGLVETQREEITLHNGKKWRIRYWSLNKKKIYQLSAKYLSTTKKHEQFPEAQLPHDSIYQELSHEAWASRRTTT